MTEIVAIAAVALVAWFAAGTIGNVRRGRELMRWMQDGLPVLGGRTTVRWLGSTAVEMVIRDGKAPFASLTWSSSSRRATCPGCGRSAAPGGAAIR